MINSTDINNTARYFDIASAYVPNQFTVYIVKRGAKTQINRTPNPNNPLYLLNLEPWTIEDISFPQIKFKQSDDIYVDANSLIKPNYILAVETTGNIEITVREKSDLAIYRSLIRCQTEMFNNRYEYSGENPFGTGYFLSIRMKSQRFDANTSDNENIFGDIVLTYDRVILSNISNPKLAYSDKSFLRYSVTFETSSMAESFISEKQGNTSGFTTASFGNPASTIGKLNKTADSSTTLSSSDRTSNGIHIPFIDELITSTANQIGNNVSKNMNITMDRVQNSYSVDGSKIDSSIKATTGDVDLEGILQSKADETFTNAVDSAKSTKGVVGIGAKLVF